MKKTKKLDFSKAVRGKYYAWVQEGTNLMLIAPDRLDTFPTPEAVNDALRSLKSIADRTTKPAVRARSRNSLLKQSIAND